MSVDAKLQYSYGYGVDAVFRSIKHRSGMGSQYSARIVIRIVCVWYDYLYWLNSNNQCRDVQSQWLHAGCTVTYTTSEHYLCTFLQGDEKLLYRRFSKFLNFRVVCCRNRLNYLPWIVSDSENCLKLKPAILNPKMAFSKPS